VAWRAHPFLLVLDISDGAERAPLLIVWDSIEGIDIQRSCSARGVYSSKLVGFFSFFFFFFGKVLAHSLDSRLEIILSF
jgi:hypothetical protein